MVKIGGKNRAGPSALFVTLCQILQLAADVAVKCSFTEVDSKSSFVEKVENVENDDRGSFMKMRRSPGNRGHAGNWRNVVSGK